MGTIHDELSDKLIDFIESQRMFFVATAPLAGDGHVNLSPKGMDSLRVLDRHTVAYLDVTGSGVETISHLKENGRMVIMFCAFQGKPLILRLHGHGEVLEHSHPEFAKLLERFPELPARRAIIRLHVQRIADSCGWTVPLYAFEGVRDYYANFAANLTDTRLREAQIGTNMRSIDALPGLEAPTV